MEGRRHDSAMLRSSKLLDFLDSQETVFDGIFIYGDPAYGVSHRLLSQENLASTRHASFNRHMSSVRESFEWTFGLLKGLRKFIDYKSNRRFVYHPSLRPLLWLCCLPAATLATSTETQSARILD